MLLTFKSWTIDWLPSITFSFWMNIWRVKLKKTCLPFDWTRVFLIEFFKLTIYCWSRCVIYCMKSNHLCERKRVAFIKGYFDQKADSPRPKTDNYKKEWISMQLSSIRITYFNLAYLQTITVPALWVIRYPVWRVNWPKVGDRCHWCQWCKTSSTLRPYEKWQDGGHSLRNRNHPLVAREGW